MYMGKIHIVYTHFAFNCGQIRRRPRNMFSGLPLSVTSTQLTQTTNTFVVPRNRHNTVAATLRALTLSAYDNSTLPQSRLSTLKVYIIDLNLLATV